MCGIAGIFDTTGRRPIDRDLLARMNRSQTHRGPDDEGFHIELGVGLAHRRLSIIDIAGGHQPLANEDGQVVVVYNGEIYNFKEIARQLHQAGHRFRTHCDTEVIVHAWEQWGERCVERFRGMFAFALWDRNSETVFLARDRLGIKPLYYAELPDGQLIFSSELKALKEHPGLPREIDPCAVEDYFAFGYIPEPKTIYSGVYKLKPGHTLKVERGRTFPGQREYWDVPFRSLPAMGEAELDRELVERLREAVRIRLVAEVPLGAFLSGGVDSSAVVAMMAGLDTRPVKTCSISFGDPEYNEARYARQVADQYGTDHQARQVDPEDFSLVADLAGLYDEPYADSSALPTYRLCELARRYVTVALSGDGGDENFAGYRRYRWHTHEERIRALVPPSIRRPLFGFLGSVYPKADWAPKVLRAKATLQGMARDTVSGYMHSVGILGEDLRRRLFSTQFRHRLAGYRSDDVLRHHAERAPTDHPLSLVQYLDMKTYLPGDILTKVDRASMAHSLEVRVPILDHEFVEWVSGLPPRAKLRGREGKYVFKRALRPFLSDDILYRPKMGFSVPLARWFRGPLRERLTQSVLGPVLGDTGIFNHKFLASMLDQHASGVRDFSAALWTVQMFEAFLSTSKPRASGTATQSVGQA